jgi:hypothetical protein
MTPRHEPRSLIVQQAMEKLLQPFTLQEQAIIHGRMMAHVTVRDTHQEHQLQILFGEAYTTERKYLTRPRSGGPDAYHRTSAP